MKSRFILLLLLLMTVPTYSQTAVTPSGSGTSGDPYLIESLDNLFWITQNPDSWSSFFRQTTDLNASSTSSWDSGNGFLPIGNNSNNFKGSYDGDGHEIDGIYIARSNKSYIGLFGYASGAGIKNIGVINVNISGDFEVGGLVGYSVAGTSLNNCYTTGSVSGSGDIGGLVGYNEGSITKCFSTSSVLGSGGNQGIGGLVGNNSNGETISSSYSTGTVSAAENSFVGGLVGSNGGTAIFNSYSTGSVSGNNYVGGLVGGNFNGSVVGNSYSIGSVISGGSSVGGFVGLNSSATISNSFWDTETSGKNSSAGGTGKTTSEMKTQSTFTNAGWDFTTIWSINTSINNGYPSFTWQTGVTEVENNIELMPRSYSLSQNYPNPFNPSTQINFYLPNNSAVTIKIYDMLGREVKTLLNKQTEAGNHIVYWNGKNGYGINASSGIYIYRLTAVNNSNSIFTETKKMTLLK